MFQNGHFSFSLEPYIPPVEGARMAPPGLPSHHPPPPPTLCPCHSTYLPSLFDTSIFCVPMDRCTDIFSVHKKRRRDSRQTFSPPGQGCHGEAVWGLTSLLLKISSLHFGSLPPPFSMHLKTCSIDVPGPNNNGRREAEFDKGRYDISKANWALLPN